MLIHSLYKNLEKGRIEFGLNGIFLMRIECSPPECILRVLGHGISLVQNDQFEFLRVLPLHVHERVQRLRPREGDDPISGREMLMRILRGL